MSSLENYHRTAIQIGAFCSWGLCLLIAWISVIRADAAEASVEWTSLTFVPNTKLGFRRIDASTSQIRFVNALDEKSAERNRILENGSGVAAADVDGDGWIDLYFCRLEGDNALYRNLGAFQFEDVTEDAGVGVPNQASTGAAFADVDRDGDPDLLVAGVGAGVRLFSNDGKGHFEEVLDSGLDREAGSMSLALADADQDGDLDLYVTNYQTVTWKDFPPGVKPRVSRVGGKPVAFPKDRFVASLRKDGSTAITEIGQPDGFYLNSGDGRFEKVDWLSGRFLDDAGNALQAELRHWGLSVAFRDFNGDRLPDLYVCNDFLYGEDDFFLNQGSARFRRVDKGALRHTSWSSMAVDVADINRDGDFDFMVVDMLSQDLTRRLTQRANYETGSQLRKVGLFLDRPQQQHNTLFLNRGDGTYAEIAHLAGVEASEWSWSLAFLDVDLDGFEDVLIGNGHAHDLLDGDVTMDAMRAMRSAPRGQAPRTLLMYPRLDMPDVAFRNRGDLTFEDVSAEWGFNVEGVSSALCRADLDQDGDWDVVVNRLQAEALIFENVGDQPRIKVSLRGSSSDTTGAGSLVRLIPEGDSDSEMPMQQQELVLGGRYLSSDAPALVFAGGGAGQSFRLEVEWSSGRHSRVEGVRANRHYVVSETGDLALKDPSSGSLKKSTKWFRDVSSILKHRHESVNFDDRVRQTLLPRVLSQMGPGLSWADVDHDGFEDLLVVGGLGKTWSALMNQSGERFQTMRLEASSGDYSGGLWLNTVGETFQFLVGRSNYPEARLSQASVELFDLKKGSSELAGSLPGQTALVGPLVSLDSDQDGDLDLFVGGRLNPGRYPEPAISRLYTNNSGRFELDLENSRAFVELGMVSGAVASDLDGDGDSDLALAVEWGSVQVWVNDGGRFINRSDALGLSQLKGWWNGVAVGDFDEDGRMDLVATNWGRNTKYERYRAHPIRLSFGDIDRNGTMENFEQVYDVRAHRWGGVRDLIIMGTAVPALQQRTHSYREYAEMGLEKAFGPGIRSLERLEANWLESTVFLNRETSFEAVALPIEAQMAPGFGVSVGDFNGDLHEDLFLGQNFFGTDPGMPRNDGGQGLLLVGDGRGAFTSVPALESGIRVLGEQRGVATADFNRDGRLDLAVSQVGAETKLYENLAAPKAHRVSLTGAPGNRRAVGAVLRIGGTEGRGPRRELANGSGYRSQDSLVTLWPVADVEQRLEITWPDGLRSSISLTGEAKEWRVAWPGEKDK